MNQSHELPWGPEVKLPRLTPVTQDAREQLLSWNVAPHLITTIQETTGRQNGQYLRCVEKMAAIKTVYFGPDLFGDHNVIIPYFYNRAGERPTGGQCGDLAIQTFLDLEKSSVKKILREGPSYLKIQIVHGQSRTHFNRPRLGHVWLGITRVLEGRFVKDHNMVVVDPAFQEISHINSNGYRMSRKFDFTPGMEREHALKRPLSDINLGKALRAPTQDEFPWNGEIVGMSSDGMYGLGLGFIKRRGNPQPYIMSRYESGQHFAVSFQDKNDHVRTVYSSPDANQLSGAAQHEIGGMLSIAEQFEYRKMKPEDEPRLMSVFFERG